MCPTLSKPEPIVPRSLIAASSAERIDYKGSVLVQLQLKTLNADNQKPHRERAEVSRRMPPMVDLQRQTRKNFSQKTIQTT
jgi:hypothetical protein